jgi:hypothetical protein
MMQARSDPPEGMHQTGQPDKSSLVKPQAATPKCTKPPTKGLAGPMGHTVAQQQKQQLHQKNPNTHATPAPAQDTPAARAAAAAAAAAAAVLPTLGRCLAPSPALLVAT